MAEPFIGQIGVFGFNFAPKNWALCQGQLLAISQNQALFALLGTFYGGDGVQTFALPDLRGREPVGFGQGLGLPNYNIAQVGGVENTTLTTNQLPQHTHAMTATLSAGGGQPHASLVTPQAGSVLGHAVDISGKTPPAAPAIYCPAGTATPTALGGLNVSAGLAGNGLPVSILAPFLVINYCIALFGVFPSRN